MISNEDRILTIQSHVVHGYVGNKIAMYTLQVLGFETDSINSVHFSNHTYYDHFKGQILASEELHEVFEGLKLNGIDKKYTHLITGYIKSNSFAEEILKIVKHLKKENNLLYLCDPVLGDNGKVYVPDELILFFRDNLLKLADIITPNQFESELLTDIKITNEEKAIECLKALHQKGPEVVVISSTSYKEKDGLLIGFVSKKNKTDDTFEMYKIEIPKFDYFFVGTGDFFSSLFLNWYIKTEKNIKKSLELSISTLQHVLQKTVDYSKTKENSSKNRSYNELRIIQSKSFIENPEIQINCISI